MIIRKPYAFLIKYFKWIHIAMFIMFGYFIFSIKDIQVYFTNAVLSNNMSSIASNNTYFTFLYFLFAILLLIMSVAIFFLMRDKKKPFIFYLLTTIYSVLLIVMAIVFKSYFTAVAKSGSYPTTTIVLYRDFTTVMYYLNFVFVIFSFVRGFGFDIKKFSFDKDKQELNIDQEDSAEVVLDINIDKDKIFNKARKYKREWSYVYEDNKPLFKKVGIGLLIAIFVYIVVNGLIINKSYKMGTFIDAGSFGIRIDKVILSNKDAYGEVRDRNYAGVLFTIKTGADGTYFDNRFLRLKINDEYYYSTQSVNSIMGDLGKVYNNELLAGKKELSYVLLFDYDKEISASKVFLEIYLSGRYHKINIDYIVQDKKGYKEKSAKLGEEIKVFGGFTINSFEIHGGTADYRYTEPNCKENCKEYTKRIQPNLNEKLLELYVKYESNEVNNKLLDYYVSLEYEKDGKTYYNTAKKMNLLNYATLSDGQRLYYSINSDVATATKKYLVITTRDVKYKILLQEENE